MNNHYGFAVAERCAAESKMDLDETITRRELIYMVDDFDGMDRFILWLTGEANCWPNWVDPYR